VAHASGIERFHDGDDRERNLELGTSWFQRRDSWPALPVDDGPDTWQRVTAEIVESERVNPFDDQSRKVDYVAPVETIEEVALPAVAVTDLDMGQQSVSFSVDEVGVPILVRVSYFPNWKVEGADGPFRAGPNHMVVVPTSNDVTLTYDSRSALDWFFYALTALGIALCFVWRRQGDVVHAGPMPTFKRPTPETVDGADVELDTPADPNAGLMSDPNADPVPDPDADPNAGLMSDPDADPLPGPEIGATAESIDTEPTPVQLPAPLDDPTTS